MKTKFKVASERNLTSRVGCGLRTVHNGKQVGCWAPWHLGVTQNQMASLPRGVGLTAGRTDPGQTTRKSTTFFIVMNSNMEFPTVSLCYIT